MNQVESVQQTKPMLCPALSQFIDRMPTEQVCTEAPLEAYLQVFREALNSSLVEEVVGYELGQIATCKQYIPAGSNEIELQIFRSESASMSLKLTPPKYVISPVLQSFSEHVFIGILIGEKASIQIYEQCQPYRNDLLDRTHPLVERGIVDLSRGEPHAFRAGSDVFRAVGSETAILYAILSLKTPLRFRWSYDPATLLPTRIVAADSTASRIEFACSLLGQIADERSIPSLRRLLSHTDHFVRWAAINAIMSIDPDEGMPLFHLAINDVHPHIRNAAARAIARARQEMFTGDENRRLGCGSDD